MIITIFGIFFLLMMPFVSFLLPAFKIKRMKSLTVKEKVVVNLGVIILISIIDYTSLIPYLGIYLIIEMLYYYFDKVKSNISIFDRVMISSGIVTAIVVGLVYIIAGSPSEMIDSLKGMTLEAWKALGKEIDPRLSNEMVSFMKKNFIFLAFLQSLICSYVTYFILESKSYRTWKMSYKWLLVYIVTFFTINIGKIDNYFINNLFEISKLIYVIFGIKEIYIILRGNRDKFRGLAKFVALITAFTFPMGVFLLGALKSFNLKASIQKK